MTHRNPYVGAGADGARRSANVDLEEADTLDRTDPRRDELIASAARWVNQATELELAEADVPRGDARLAAAAGEALDIAAGIGVDAELVDEAADRVRTVLESARTLRYGWHS